MTDTPPTSAPREGSLEAPFRHPIAWRDPDFYDLANVEAEMERVLEQLGETDRNGKLAGAIAPFANWASAQGNGLTRPVMEATFGIDRTALLPKYNSRKASDLPVPAPDPAGPAFGKRKAVIYA